MELNQSLWKQYERGELGREEILYKRFDLLFEDLGVTMDGHTAENIYRKYLDEGCYVIPGAVELLQALSRSYEIYIVTNGSVKTQSSRLRGSRLESTHSWFSRKKRSNNWG